MTTKLEQVAHRVFFRSLGVQQAQDVTAGVTDLDDFAAHGSDNSDPTTLSLSSGRESHPSRSRRQPCR